MKIDRRRFLGLGAALGAGLAATGAARALQLQPADVKTQALYNAACEAPTAHLQLLAEFEAKLQGRELAADEVAAIKAAARCPVCGCALVPPSGALDKPAF